MTKRSAKVSVENKTIIVTGAASGIGAETAKFLKERGATVIGFDRNEPTDNVDEFIQIDLSSEANITEACAAFKGKADALCNIAGVPPSLPPIPVLTVNFLGLRTFTHAMLPKLNDNASIVNIASLAGMAWRNSIEEAKALFEIKDYSELEAFISAHNIDQENCYEFSKEALIIWTMQQWNSFGRGIRVNAVSPSATHTPILQDFMETVAKRVKARTEGMGERPSPGQPEDIAPIIGFLCSDDSKWLNGTNITADGGLFAAMTRHQLQF